MAEPKQLREEESKIYRLFKEFQNESRTIIISSIALIVSLLTWFIAGISLYTSTSADAKVDYELKAHEDIDRQNREKIDLWIAYTMTLRAKMEAAGLEPPPLPEDE